MLPTNVFQFSYDHLQELVNDKYRFINEYQEEHGKYDCIIGFSKSGVFPSFVLANLLNIPFLLLDENVDLFLNKHRLNPLDNYLIVDSVCSDERLEEIKEHLLARNFKSVSTYSVFVHSEVISIPLFFNIIEDRYFLGPWNSNSFTPETHLERILNGDVKKYPKNTYLFGFSSKECFNSVSLGNKIPSDWIQIFDEENNKLISSSLIDSMDMESKKERDLSFFLYKVKPYMDNKINFIKSNGITHFFENCPYQSFIISDNCPTVHVYFTENQNTYKILSKKIKQL